MDNIIENIDGLYGLIGIPETNVLYANPEDIIIIHVDPANTEEQMHEHAKKVKALLPTNDIIVLPKNVLISTFPANTGNGVYVTRVLETE
jgi:tetrahydromethanopterin S-methyltransferase subunit B